MNTLRTRRNLLLNDENFQWVKDWFKENHFPKTTLALCMDDFILGLRRTIAELEKRKETGESICLSDLFAVTGHTMENLNKLLQDDSGVVNSTKPQQ